MQKMEIMDLLKRTGAYKQGHFRLSSGLHSGAYLQCALLLQDPFIASRLCSELAKKFIQFEPDVILGPAMGGVILSYELARALKARAVFTERDEDGIMTLRRGFRILPTNRVLIAEDVLTTGRSVKEVLSILDRDSIKPVGITSLVDRSGSVIDFGGIRQESLIKLDIPAFEETECPFCQEGIPIVKPGSRKIK